MVVPTTRYSVSFALLCETSPKQNAEKNWVAVLVSGRKRPVQQICAEILQKRFWKSILREQKGTIAHLCAAGCGAASPTLLSSAVVGRAVFLIDRLDYLLDYALDYLLDYRYQKKQYLCGLSDFKVRTKFHWGENEIPLRWERNSIEVRIFIDIFSPVCYNRFIEFFAAKVIIWLEKK